jgi:hypothetical protein
MSYTINPSPCGRYIIVKVKGEITGQSAIQQNIEAHAQGEKLGITRYLVDAIEARNTSSILENYTFAYGDMKTVSGINKLARIAMLVSPDDHSHDFVETLAKNAGFDATLFRDRDEAIQHLLRGL